MRTAYHEPPLRNRLVGGYTVHVVSAPLIAVRDVPAASSWYQTLLGCESDMNQAHPHPQEYDRILDETGILLLEIHSWGGKPSSEPIDFYLDKRPGEVPPGDGIIIGFTVEDFDETVERARGVGAEFLCEVADYPDGSRRVLVRDENGYVVQLRSPEEV
jgi:catechol 2,3-dioxygenase-like lactoylglutathione lyase family enzyme